MNTPVQTTPEQPGMRREDRAAEVSALPGQTRIVSPFANPGVVPCNIGSTAPALSNRPFPWVRQTASDTDRNLYLYSNGKWRNIYERLNLAGMGNQKGTYAFSVAQTGSVRLVSGSMVDGGGGAGTVSARLAAVQSVDPITNYISDPLSNLWVTEIATFSPAYAAAPFAQAMLAEEITNTAVTFGSDVSIENSILAYLTGIYGSSEELVKHFTAITSLTWALGTSAALDQLYLTPRVSALATATKLSVAVRFGYFSVDPMLIDVVLTTGPEYNVAVDLPLIAPLTGGISYSFNIEGSVQWATHGEYPVT